MLNSETREYKGAASPALTGTRAWVLALCGLGVAHVLRIFMDPYWGNRLPYGLFFLMALIVMHYTEAGPSMLVIVGGLLLGAWSFVPPRHSLAIHDPVDRFNAVVYLAICCVILFYTRRTRRALARERSAWMATGRLAAIIESSEDAIIGRSLEGKIVSWNTGASNLYGYTEAEAKSQPVTFLVAPENGDELLSVLDSVGRGEQIRHLETTQKRKDGALVEVSLSVSPVRNNAGEIVGVSTIARDIGERKRGEREMEHMVGELQRLLGEVKTLSGLLPICSYCKKIRDDKGYWNQIEHYIGQHSRANFTHSVCPECAKNQYAEFLADRPKGI